ncbi:MAG: GDSL-type esterase/lipase family protein [Planctomycetia bacterium]|nr:GDSL-type esterase/lipase family protein [Planctomycetia bacterium]
MQKKMFLALLVLGCAVLCGSQAFADTVKIVNPWAVEAESNGVRAVFDVPVPNICEATDQTASIPPFRFNKSGWQQGYALKGVKAIECSVTDAVDPASVQVKSVKNGKIYLADKDYKINNWGCIGTLEGGSLINADTPFAISYRYAKMRIDSIVRNAEGSLAYLAGEPHAVNPAQPQISADQKRIANIWIPGRISELNDDLIFLIQPKGNKAKSPKKDPVAKTLVPKTWKKLIEGKEVRILAWGDSVTAGNFLPQKDKWQFQFADRLQKLFPNAKITLISEAWGGRNSDSYRREPKGSPKNYEEKVLAVKPDLIVSEFVNDSGMSIDRVQIRYGEMLKDFQKNGMEWIICSPHYVRPDWMKFTGNKNLDQDPRPYVAGIRKFAKENGVALADASLLYGQLWREGIPYHTLMVNSINHPNAFGMKLFADALMELFGE